MGATAKSPRRVPCGPAPQVGPGPLGFAAHRHHRRPRNATRRPKRCLSRLRDRLARRTGLPCRRAANRLNQACRVRQPPHDAQRRSAAAAQGPRPLKWLGEAMDSDHADPRSWPEEPRVGTASLQRLRSSSAPRCSLVDHVTENHGVGVRFRPGPPFSRVRLSKLGRCAWLASSGVVDEDMGWYGCGMKPVAHRPVEGELSISRGLIPKRERRRSARHKRAGRFCGRGER